MRYTEHTVGVSISHGSVYLSFGKDRLEIPAEHAVAVGIEMANLASHYMIGTIAALRQEIADGPAPMED